MCFFVRCSKLRRTCVNDAHVQELAAAEARGLAANPQAYEGGATSLPPPVDTVLQNLQGTVRVCRMAHNPLAFGHCLYGRDASHGSRS